MHWFITYNLNQIFLKHLWYGIMISHYESINGLFQGLLSFDAYLLSRELM